MKDAASRPSGTSRPTSRGAWLLLLVFALLGALLCASLAFHHYGSADSTSPLAGFCGAGSSCDEVLSSRWSVFPPAPRETGEGADSVSSPETRVDADSSRGIPVSLLGLGYYSALLVWFGLLGPRALDPGMRLGFFRLPLHLVILSCLGSLAFLGIMQFSIGSWCPLCLASHLCNFVFLGILLRSTLLQRGNRAPNRPPAPPRLVAAVILLAAVTVVGEWGVFRSIGLARSNASLKAFASRASNLEVVYLESPKHELNIRENDPIIPAAPGSRMTLVVFSDIECPHCASFDRFLHEEILPLFRGHLRVVFKHSPIERHEHAFEAARALEAARQQGAFWKAKKSLFQQRTELAGFDYEVFATKLGLDPEQFLRDMAAPETETRIREDMATLSSVLGGRTSIPSVFLNDRLLDNRMRSIKGFWQNRADALRRIRLHGGLDWGAHADAPDREVEGEN